MSINAQIVRPVFSDLPAKWLQIPHAIDDYNHYMNGVDWVNQLRRNFTVHQPFESRVWRPLWYYILDVCTVNSYLIWKGNSTTKDKSKRGQRRFRKPLIDALLTTPYKTNPHGNCKPMPPANQKAPKHQWKEFLKRNWCIWCKEHAANWVPKRATGVLNEIVNGVAPARRQRQSKTYGGCEPCNVYLCRKGTCFEQYHDRSNTK